MLPADTPVANPPAEIVATPVALELQVAELVQFCVELSEKTRVAVYCNVPATLMVLAPGATVTLEGVGVGGPGAVTVKVVFPEIPPTVAVIVDVPAEIPVDIPDELIVATPVLPDVHEGVQFCVDPSLYSHAAVNCC